MNKMVLVGLVTLLLAGCQLLPSQPPAEVGEVPPPTTQQPPPPPPAQQETVPPPAVEVVPPPPKLTSYDWAGSMTPLVNQMVNATKGGPGKVLLLDSVKNNTNGSIKVSSATDVLYQVLDSNPFFKVLPMQAVQQAESGLGLSASDSLGSRSKAIGLARYLNASYVLYSTLTGTVKQPECTMQLLEVQTGELIWSGRGPIHVND